MHAPGRAEKVSASVFDHNRVKIGGTSPLVDVEKRGACLKALRRSGFHNQYFVISGVPEGDHRRASKNNAYADGLMHMYGNCSVGGGFSASHSYSTSS